MQKILLICNGSNQVMSFRKELILFLKKNHFDVHVLASDDLRKDEITALDVNFYSISFNNRDTNPFLFLKTKRQMGSLIRQIKPDIVFTFQIKPNIIGASAAIKNGVASVFSMVEGLGDPFQPKTIKEKIILKIIVALYKKSFKKVKTVFFLNNNDRDDFINRHIVSNENSLIIHSIGIDTSKFIPTYQPPKDKNILMLARLIKSKGIIDYCEIAKTVKKTRDDITFYLYGEEAQLTKDDLKKYIDDNIIFYGGFSKQITELISNCSILLSTSFYKEGFPRTLLEGMALGKPAIVSNIVGNKDAIEDGINGFIIEKNDVDGFANKILSIIDDEDLLIKLGKNARKICVEKYDSEVINKQILETIRSKTQ